MIEKGHTVFAAFTSSDSDHQAIKIDVFFCEIPQLIQAKSRGILEFGHHVIAQMRPLFANIRISPPLTQLIHKSAHHLLFDHIDRRILYSPNDLHSLSRVSKPDSLLNEEITESYGSKRVPTPRCSFLLVCQSGD
jgi:hypothetical protein